MWRALLDTRGASLLEETASRVEIRLQVRGLPFNLSISSAVKPMDVCWACCWGTPGFCLLALELWPESCDITGLFRLRSLLLWTSLPTPPELEVVARRALWRGFPEMSCSVRMRGCWELSSELGESLASGVL